MRKQSLIFCIAIVVNLSASHAVLAECGASSSQIHALEQSSELSALEIFTIDLEDAFDLIDSGDKKTALTILKSALKEIRKIKEFSTVDKKNFTKKVNKIIKLVKSGSNDNAMTLIDEILSDLSGTSDDEEDFSGGNGGV